MIRISNTSWIVRCAYWGGDYIPRNTTLCALFWRCVGLSPLKALLIAVFGPIFLVVVGVTKAHAKYTARRRRLDEAPRISLRERWRESAANDVLFTMKHRVCPVVYIERGDEASGVTK